jgi:hypothetical protein
VSVKLPKTRATPLLTHLSSQNYIALAYIQVALSEVGIALFESHGRRVRFEGSEEAVGSL